MKRQMSYTSRQYPPPSCTAGCASGGAPPHLPPLPTASGPVVVPEIVVPPVSHVLIAPMGEVMAVLSAGSSVFQGNEPAYTERNFVPRLLLGMPEDVAPLIHMGALQTGGGQITFHKPVQATRAAAAAVVATASEERTKAMARSDPQAYQSLVVLANYCRTRGTDVGCLLAVARHVIHLFICSSHHQV